MDEIESSIRRVVEDHHQIISLARTEEAKIDGLDKEIKILEDRIQEPESSELELQRLHNLLNYQSTLIWSASSRTQLLTALHEDLLNLFIRRKQLRESDGIGAPSVDVVPNVSHCSGLSSGEDDNQGFPSDCSLPASIDSMRMAADQENLEEITTADQDPTSLSLKMLEVNMNEDASLAQENFTDYDNLQYKNNILDNIAMNMMDPNASIDDIFEEPMGNADFLCETQGSKELSKRVDLVASGNLSGRLAVDFDEAGSPTGAHAGAFKRAINSYACQFLPIRFKQIGDVPVEDYKLVLNALTERYNFDVNRSYTRKKISSCYRQHKYKLLVQIKKDLMTGTEPKQPSYVKKDDWDAFVAKTKDEEFDKISKKNKASRSQQSAVNRKNSSSTAAHKRKPKEPEQESEDCIRSKTSKAKRGCPKVLLAVPENNHDAVDTIGELDLDQEVVALCTNRGLS